MDARSILPVLAWGPAYRRAYLARDVFAGIVLTAILVPAGIGYAEAAGLPGIVGLYATIVPLLAYAVFGPSRILVLGPDSSLLPLVAAAVIPLAGGDDAQKVVLSALLATIVGVVIIGAGLARLGFLTELLSAPVRIGYLNGIAIIVFAGQLPKLFGFATTGDSIIDRAQSFFEGIRDGKTEPASLAIGLASLVVILGLRRWQPRIPGIFVAVVGSTLLSAALDLEARGVDVVGTLPTGLPPLTIPPPDIGTILALVPAALGIALVAGTDTSVLSRTFAIRRGDTVEPDRELVALGAANLATGLFSGMPVSSSASRTPVAEAAGAQTQLTSVVGAVAIGGMLVVVPGLLADLPASTLAAVVIAAAFSLVDVRFMVRLWRIGSAEFWLVLASLLGVAFVGVIQGVFFAVALSLLAFVRRAWVPHDAVLGRADGVKGYHDLTYYPDARQVPGLLLYRFDAPLFFANADAFRARLRERIEAAPSPVQWVVIAAEPITDVDTTAAQALDELDAELKGRGITLVFAELKDPVRARLRRFEALEDVPDDRFFPTVGAAVTGYLRSTGRAWTDWQDEGPSERP